ncbi:DUF389 domain-containing protein [Streptomyces composti]|uniref:DUF389 domain-containing protein n=1 Tax=Streptomyces composti TaxID=2720025 RepID=UPI001F0DFC9C|nr:DUF389 domain-containing protein [Streptomyces composti]
MDLVAALATGLAGAVAPARRDVAAVLPGVAIAISPVPPLVVTGVCRGRPSGWPALGVLVPFVSNLFALVFGGMVMFAALGCREGRHRGHGGPAAARMWPGPARGWVRRGRGQRTGEGREDSGTRCEDSSARCEDPGARCEDPGARCEDSSATCEGFRARREDAARGASASARCCNGTKCHRRAHLDHRE